MQKLYVITDTEIQKRYSHFELASMAIEGGANMIQFRDKKMSSSAMLDECWNISELCKDNNVIFIVNDRVDIAQMSGARGVHLGNKDIPLRDARKLLGENAIIGATVHSPDEALKAEEDGANYIAYGHIFDTKTKKTEGKPRGIKSLQKILSLVDVPVFAIGGINHTNVDELLRLPLFGIAVISSVCASRNPVRATRRFYNKLFKYLYL
jgi:thiamine-phosphate pyrophosphorylase